LVVAAVLASRGHAADRAASSTLATVNPMADITDVYAWMVSSTSLALVMDVSPQDNGSHGFDPTVLYAFHLTSKSGLGVNTTDGTETKVICRFASGISVQCWVVAASGVKDYVTGDPSNPAGVTSPSGKVKVFAGRRSDPASFNVAGFNAAISTYATYVGRTPDLAGCPTGITTAEADGLRTTLRTGPDAFSASNVMAIVVQLDKSLINLPGNTVVAVWGSTHAGT
jgi:hypothetical protein